MEPSYTEALGYDAVKAIAEALRDAPNTGKGIREGLHHVAFDGASGHVEFDEHGQRVGSVPVVIVDRDKSD